MEQALEMVNEEWSRALAVVAHPDDLEYGAAAAVARWTAQGKHVAYCLATSGEAGIDGMDPREAAPIREQEERAGAAKVGVSDVRFLGYPDGIVEYSLPLRRDIARTVREFKPDIVITGNHYDTFAPGLLNQADHVAVGRAALDAVRDAANRWVFPELIAEGLDPWSASRVLIAGSQFALHAVDVSDSFDRGVASLEAHDRYLKGLGNHVMADPREFLEALARSTGTRLGTRLAVAFESITL